MTIRINVRNILEYMLMFIVFINGQSVYIRLIEKQRFIIIAYFAIAITLLLIVLYNRMTRIDILTVAIMLVYLIAYGIITRARSDVSQYLIRICIVFPLFYLLSIQLWRTNHIKPFVLKFSNIVCIFAAISLILYILGTNLHLLQSNVLSYDWAKEIKRSANYFYLMFEAQETEFMGFRFIRNCGIFAEAPSYAVPLILSLYIEMFIREHARKLNIAILCVTIISTWSTKAISIGLVVIGLKMLCDIYLNKKKPSGFKQIMKVIAPVILLFGCSFALGIVGDKIDTSSGFMRVDNIYTGIKAFWDNPMFGVGFENETALNTYALYMTRSGGLAMGIPVLLGEGGVHLTLFYLVGILWFLVNSSNRSAAISFVIVHFLILFTSNIPYFLSTILILAIEFSTPRRKIFAIENHVIQTHKNTDNSTRYLT